MKIYSDTFQIYRIGMLLGIFALVTLSQQIATATNFSKDNWHLNSRHVSTDRTRPDKTTQDQILLAYDHRPLRFEANVGQTVVGVRFAARIAGYTLLLRPHDILIALPAMGSRQASHEDLPAATAGPSQKKSPRLVKMRLVDSNPNPEVLGLDRLAGRINYFSGNSHGQRRCFTEQPDSELPVCLPNDIKYPQCLDSLK